MKWPVWDVYLKLLSGSGAGPNKRLGDKKRKKDKNGQLDYGGK